MPNKTKNIGLTTWLESDVVDFEQVNDNFEKIDALVNCIEAGVIVGSYDDGGTVATTNWHYKKYSNGSVKMDAKLVFNNLICDTGDEIPYYSDSVTITYPFQFSSVYSVQMHAVSNGITWVADITGKTVVDSTTFRLVTRAKESGTVYKQVYITVKGWLA